MLKFGRKIFFFFYKLSIKIYLSLIFFLFILDLLISQPSWLYPGMYAIYRTYSRILYIDGRYLNIKDGVYGWRISDLKDDKAIVEVFIGYRLGDRYINISKTAFLDLKSRKVFDEKGKFIGIWPFWLNPWEIGRKEVIFSKKFGENCTISLVMSETHYDTPIACGKYIYSVDFYETTNLSIYGHFVKFILFYDHATGLLVVNDFGDDMLISLFGIIGFSYVKGVDPKYSNAISLLDTNVVELHGGMLGNLKIIIISLIILFGWISIRYIFLRKAERYEAT